MSRGYDPQGAPPRWYDGMTWVGWVNFIVLQWFGLRLTRILAGHKDEPGGTQAAARTIGWATTRWVWPLTGWWSDYRWIRRVR